MSRTLNDRSVFSLSLDATALHGPAGDIVHPLTPHSEADPDAPLSQRLEARGSVIGLSPSMLVGSDRHQLPTQPMSPPADHYVLRQAGAMWESFYDGVQIWIKDTKGLPYLAYLLRYPHHDFPILELVQLVERGKVTNDYTMSQESLAKESLYALPSETEALPDQKALMHYRNCLRDIGQELEEARQNNDRGRIESLEKDQETLMEELKRVYKGRWRKRSPEEDKERQRVTKAVGRVKTAIKELCPALYEHLNASLHTGFTFAYRPRPQSPPWKIFA